MRHSPDGILSNYGYYLLPITYYLFLRNSFAFHKKGLTLFDANFVLMMETQNVKDTVRQIFTEYLTRTGIGRLPNVTPYSKLSIPSTDTSISICSIHGWWIRRISGWAGRLFIILSFCWSMHADHQASVRHFLPIRKIIQSRDASSSDMYSMW